MHRTRRNVNRLASPAHGFFGEIGLPEQLFERTWIRSSMNPSGLSNGTQVYRLIRGDQFDQLGTIRWRYPEQARDFY